MKELLGAIEYCESRLKYLIKTNPVPSPRIQTEIQQLKSRLNALVVHYMVCY